MLDTDQDFEAFPGFEGSAVRFLNDSRRAGQPITISIGGEHTLAIDDDESFRKLFQLVDRLEAIESIRIGLRQVDEGKGVSLEEFLARSRNKNGIPR